MMVTRLAVNLCSAVRCVRWNLLIRDPFPIRENVHQMLVVAVLRNRVVTPRTAAKCGCALPCREPSCPLRSAHRPLKGRLQPFVKYVLPLVSIFVVVVGAMTGGFACPQAQAIFTAVPLTATIIMPFFSPSTS
jgi:hypothetical protein